MFEKVLSSEESCDKRSGYGEPYNCGCPKEESTYQRIFDDFAASHAPPSVCGKTLRPSAFDTQGTG